MTHELADELEKRWRNGDTSVRDELIRLHFPLVSKWVKKYKREHDNDAISAGLEGLVVAASRFDPNKGHFSNYASIWVRAYVLEHVRRSGVISESTTRSGRKVFLQIGRAAQKLGENATPEGLAAAIGVPVEAVRQQLARLERSSVVYIDQIEDRDQQHRIEASIAGANELDEQLDNLRERQRLQDHIALFARGLRDREFLILIERLLADEPKTLHAIGAQIGVSGERVRHLESALKRKLKEFLEAHGHRQQVDD